MNTLNNTLFFQRKTISGQVDSNIQGFSADFNLVRDLFERKTELPGVGLGMDPFKIGIDRVPGDFFRPRSDGDDLQASMPFFYTAVLVLTPELQRELGNRLNIIVDGNEEPEEYTLAGGMNKIFESGINIVGLNIAPSALREQVQQRILDHLLVIKSDNTPNADPNREVIHCGVTAEKAIMSALANEVKREDGEGDYRVLGGYLAAYHQRMSEEGGKHPGDKK